MTAHALAGNDCDGMLTIADPDDPIYSAVSLRTAAWRVLDLRPLWMPAGVRGRNVLIPGASGVRAKPRRKTETRRSVSFAVTGDVDDTGAPYSDPWDGLYTNLAYLNANVISPLPRSVSNLGGTRLATLTLPDSSTLTAQVHVSDFAEKTVPHLPIVEYDLEFSFPMGEFT